IEIDAAFALQRLHNDGGGFVIDGFDKRVVIPGRYLHEAGDLRFETLAHGGIPGRSNHRESSAMETFGEGDDLPALGGFVAAAETGKFTRGFVSFSAAVTEKGLAFKSEFPQALGEFNL